MRVLSVAVAAALAVCVLFVPAATVAQEYSDANPARVLAAVDAVSGYGEIVLITGIVQGEAAPSTWIVQGHDSAVGAGLAAMCERSALLAMSRPGQYLLEVFSGTATNRPYCKLIRVNR
jgi:hypothetical protein